MTPKIYTVTSSPSDNTYSEAQLLVSIFECIDAVVSAEAQEEVNIPQPENKESVRR